MAPRSAGNGPERGRMWRLVSGTRTRIQNKYTLAQVTSRVVNHNIFLLKESCCNYVITTFWWCTGLFSPSCVEHFHLFQINNSSVVWPSSSFSWYQPVQHCRNSTLNQVFHGSPDRALTPGLMLVSWYFLSTVAAVGMGFLQWSLWRRRRWFNGEYQQKTKKSLKKRKTGGGKQLPQALLLLSIRCGLLSDNYWRNYNFFQ